ncbi:MAG: hypothetical protein GY838_05560 [bacterium]|nr:hypothetical protein [bacterium]
MEVEFDTIEDGRIVATRLIGTIDDGDVEGLYRRLVESGRADDPRPHLVDGRQLVEPKHTRLGMEQFAFRMEKHRRAESRRVAFVADQDVMFGMFRMWEAARDEVGDETRVFRDEHEAVTWLLITDPDVD